MKAAKILFLFVSVVVATTSAAPFLWNWFNWSSPVPTDPAGAKEYGECSWYGIQTSGAQGGPVSMANGQPLSRDRFTAAHKTLPLGSYIVVTNVKNKKSVTVQVTDRGPLVFGRVAALSPAAFSALADLDAKVFPCIVSRSSATK